MTDQALEFDDIVRENARLRAINSVLQMAMEVARDSTKDAVTREHLAAVLIRYKREVFA